MVAGGGLQRQIATRLISIFPPPVTALTHVEDCDVTDALHNPMSPFEPPKTVLQISSFLLLSRGTVTAQYTDALQYTPPFFL